MAEEKKILVAEDEKPIAKAMELKLKNSGFLPTIAFDGEQALKILETEKFDIVVVDLMMPKVDGFGVLTGMKEKGINIPVIVSSNLSQKEDFEKAKELGAVDYFVKSNTPITDLVENIRKIIGE
jgi:DNA-binding response OmpR family regulator